MVPFRGPWCEGSLDFQARPHTSLPSRRCLREGTGFPHGAPLRAQGEASPDGPQGKRGRRPAPAAGMRPGRPRARGAALTFRGRRGNA